MTIAETREKCKDLAARIPRDVLLIIILVLASVLSFGLGYLAGLDASEQQPVPISISQPPFAATSTMEGKVVASKNGTKYYSSWCAGADRIAQANKVWFDSAAQARAAGYVPAAHCD